MTRILCCSAATAALLAACAPPPPPPEPLPPVPVVVQPQLSQAGMDCVIQSAAIDLYEIEAGRLALQHSTNPSVRAYAQAMIDGHTNATAQYGAALASISMNPPPAQLTPDLSARLERLRTAGSGFDAMYLDDQILAHQQALALHQACAANAGAPVAAVSAGLVPHIQGHLAQAQTLRANWSTQAGERG